MIKKEFEAAPLSSSFVLFSMLGLLISLIYVYPVISPKFGASFTLIFLIMFISSFVSMTKAPMGDEEYLNDLAIHEHHKHVRKKRNKKK